MFAMFGSLIHDLCDANLRRPNLDSPYPYDDDLVNETNIIPPSTILKISLSQSAYLLFILQLYQSI